jgi:TRAP-type mannitol/chloroaromatic compound transport system permease small subunit
MDNPWLFAAIIAGAVLASLPALALILLATPLRARALSVATGLVRALSFVNTGLGSAVIWLALAMVAVQFTIVVLRYVFGAGHIALQESVVYLHAFLFMLGAGYTLAVNGHVRVDIFHRSLGARGKALIDLAGVYLFLLPFCVLIIWVSATYVEMSWAVREGSRESSGLPYIYILKTAIPAFAVLLFTQGAAMALDAIRVLAGQKSALPGATRREAL